MAHTPIEQVLPKGTVVIAGGGPVGLILARVLSSHNIKSVLFERNETTTRWPKMDLTNARSMELFRKVGLSDELRQQGVPPHIDQDVLMSTGLSRDELLSKWELPGVDKFRERIRAQNDGTQPQEPWQRISQAIFERWLKTVCDDDPLIDVRFGWRVDSMVEDADHARATVISPDGTSTSFTSDYVVGCDGGSSTVRRSLGIGIDGGPIPVRALLVHFKSRDLQRLHKHGRFWHIFLTDKTGALGGAIIAQDEIDTWTTHLFMPLDHEENPDDIDSSEAVYRVLGGMHGQYPVKIDEILVRSIWRPVIAVTQSWAGPHRRVFLAGDAAHQNIPTGGYGMNMGIADAFDLGWKLSAVIKGQGGSELLDSYELERKPVAVRNVAHSGVHFQVHGQLKEILAGVGDDPRRVDDDTKEAHATRAQIHEHYQRHDGENKDFGIEMGYRYQSPVIVREDDSSTEPAWSPSYYTPTSWPGGRPPHLFLQDGTAMFDKFGPDWTLLIFANHECGQTLMVEAAQSLSMPLKSVDLRHETLAQRLYERNLVLIRPDQHVAWRADTLEHIDQAKKIIRIVTGRATKEDRVV